MNRSTTIRLAISFLFCFTFAVGQAPAQGKYTVLKPKNPKLIPNRSDAKAFETYERYVKQLSGLAKKALNSPLDDKGKKTLAAYYKDYVSYGLTDISQGGEFGKWRIELQKNLASAKSKDSRMYVIRIIDNYCSKIAKSSKIHPMSRFNAVLILSDLNEVESARTTPAVPFKKSQDLMVTLLASPKATDEIKMASLIGLMRHAELGTHSAARKKMAPADKARIAAAAMKLLNEAKPTAKRSEEGHDWMRRRASDLLGRLGDPGQGDTVVKALMLSITDPENSLSLRCSAAEALGHLDLSTSKVTVEDLVKRLGQLAVACSREEVEAIKEALKSANSGRFGGEGGGGRRGGRGGAYGNEFGAEGDDEIVFVDETTLPARRRLLKRLNQILLALSEGKTATDDRGVNSMPGGEVAAQDAIKGINALVEHAKDPDTDSIQLGVALRDEGNDLASDVGEPAAPAVAEEAAEEPAEEPAEAAAAAPSE